MLSPTVTAFMSSSSLSFFMGGIAVDLAGRWEANGALGGLNAIALYPERFLLTLGFLLFWLLGMIGYFKTVGWPRWLALIYVLLILCPLALIFAQRIGWSGDLFALFLVQSPFILAFVLRYRSLRRVAAGGPGLTDRK